MPLPRIYESVLPHPDSEKEIFWRFLVVPAQAIPESASRSAPSILSALELTKISRLSPTRLPFVVATLLLPESPEDFTSRVEQFSQQWAQGAENLPNASREALAFAEQIIFGNLVPLERCCPESLASLVAKSFSGGDNEDTLLAESGGNRLIVVTGEDGVVIGGPHQSIVSANIWDKILRWLRGLS
jgi:hypothetical protein